MDRRGFLTATVLSLAFLAASSAAEAAPAIAPRDAIAPAGGAEDVWWYRRRWRRWGWRRPYWRRRYWGGWGWRPRIWWW